MLMKSKRLFLLLFLLSSLAFEAYENHICVSLTIKNDESTIRECLRSVANIADCISVSDVGSTDGTKKIIEEFLKSTGIPGRIYQRESPVKERETLIAAQVAQKTLQSFGFPLACSYLLMINPDQIIGSQATLLSNVLEKDSYMVLEKSEPLSYYIYKANLFRASVPVEEIQSMREGNGNSWRTIGKLKSLVLEDQSIQTLEGEGLSEEEKKELLIQKQEAFKKSKVDLNIALFSEALKRDPDHAKSLFCLAQSHKSLKHYEEAIAGYQARISKGGNAEEIWFSKFMMGECYEETGSWVHALYWYLEAYQQDPSRPESLKKIATYYRMHGQNDLAYIFAKHGWRIPKIEEGTLFPHPPLYDYQFDEEISVAAYYTRYKEEGYTASNDLLLRKDTPSHIKEQGYRNILFYVQNIKARFESIRIPLPYIDGGTDQMYTLMNPSIQKTEEGYTLICRAVNYTQVGAKYFHTVDAEGIFRTKNFLLYYDRAFNKLSHQEIVEDLPRERFRSFIVEGLEDCRIVRFDQRDWFTCSTFDTNPSGAIQIALCKMENKGFEGPVKVEKLLPLQGPDPNRHEKNWLPFVKDGELLLIYSSDPFIIYKPDLETGECTTVLQYTPEHDFSHFRGSAAPIEFDGGYLMLVHEVVQLPDYTRCYLHRFVFLDSDYLVKKTSKPFTFNHSGIEYCLSMTIDHEGERLIMPIGIEDREAYLMFVDLTEVRSLLYPLPTIYNPF